MVCACAKYFGFYKVGNLKNQNARKLVYVLNHIDQSDAEHFFHIIALLDELERRCGWKVMLLSEKGGSGIKTVCGREVHYLTSNGKIKRLFLLALALARLRSQGYRLSFVRISKPAAIISGLVGRVLGMRVLYWHSGAIHDWDKQKSKPLRRMFDEFVDQGIVSLVHLFVTGPESMLDYYEKTLRVPKRKLALLYNDVSVERFRPKYENRSDPDEVRLLIVHRLSPVRQTSIYFPYIVDQLNTAAVSGKKFLLNVIGEGPELTLLQQQSREANVNLTINFLGAIPNPKIQDYYGMADLFLMPSYREGFPRVMLEAMAMGLPIVATDAGGTLDIVGHNQRKYIVSRDDPRGFAQMLVALAGDADARQTLSAENICFVERFSTPVVADMYDRTLCELL